MQEVAKSLPQIEAEINILKTQTAQNIIEIGKRLNEAKEQVPHGEWGKWLEEKVEFSNVTASRFMRVATECSNISALKDLPQTKIFALLDIPKEDRETFIQSNPVEEMTTRELQAAIKAKKEAEEKAKYFETKVVELESKGPQIIEKEVIKEKLVVPGDYEQAKRRFAELTSKVNQKEAEIKDLQEKLKDSKDGLALKKQIEFLSKQKNDLSRQIQSATELSKLTVRLHEILKTELAPIKFSRCIEQLDQSETAVNNLVEVIDLVDLWIREIRGYLPNKNIVFVEVTK